MLRYYGIGGPAVHTWRTVTPAALPERAARRRIDPVRLSENRLDEAKSGAERLVEEARAVEAVRAALRHAGREATVNAVCVQREPFEAKGERAEAFAPNTRFAKERLWHVEVEFANPQRGPLLLGDGRYLGLGIMAPVRSADGVLAFTIASGLAAEASALMLTRALRRAVLARIQVELGTGKPLPLYFTGHEPDGAPARSGRHAHLAFAYDEARHRLLVIAPHVVERRSPKQGEGQNWKRLEAAMQQFDELRAGRAGKLRLARTPLDRAFDPLFASSRQWKSMTAYHVTRHRKCANAAAALVADIKGECQRLGLPRLDIEAARPKGISGVGLTGHAELHFATVVPGPILIGLDRHFGGGLFVGC
jgi:CRISPR-associated protein Csb2